MKQSVLSSIHPHKAALLRAWHLLLIILVLVPNLGFSNPPAYPRTKLAVQAVSNPASDIAAQSALQAQNYKRPVFSRPEAKLVKRPIQPKPALATVDENVAADN